jgi:hypothetical protein
MRNKPQLEAITAQPAFYGIAGEIVRTLEPGSEADPYGLLMTTLVRSAVLLNDHAFVPVDAGGRQYARLYSLIVGRSARARKGTAEAAIGNLFSQAFSDFEGSVRKGLSSGEGLAAALQCSDTGIAPDPRLLVVEEEFARVLAMASREGNILSSTLRELWDGGRIATMTRTNPIDVPRAHVCMSCHITSEELKVRLRSVDASNGFLNRFLVLHVSRSKRLANGGGIPEETMGLLASKWREAVKKGADIRGPVRRDQQAAELWEQWYNAVDDEVFGTYGQMVARSEAHVTRLALIYALLDGSNIIRVEHQLAAFDLWEHCELSISILWPRGASTGMLECDVILEAINKSEAGISRATISNLFSRHKSASELDAFLTILLGRNLICEVKSNTAGRPQKIYLAVQANET